LQQQQPRQAQVQEAEAPEESRQQQQWPLSSSSAREPDVHSTALAISSARDHGHLYYTQRSAKNSLRIVAVLAKPGDKIDIVDS